MLFEFILGVAAVAFTWWLVSSLIDAFKAFFGIGKDDDKK